jgi:hypothetical protein
MKTYFKINRYFLVFVFLLLTFVIWGFIKIDPSSAKLVPETAPEVFDSKYKPRPPVVFLSYANGHRVFFKNQNMLSFSAINCGIDVIHLYRQSHMDEGFYNANKDILTQPKGAGYWLWKPYFILKTMEKYPEDTVIIYADSGTVFTQPINKILEKLKTYDRVLVGRGKPVPLRKHLKKEAQIILKIDENEDVLNHQAIWGFFIVLKNTQKNKDFVKKWLHLCQQKDLLTDVPFVQENQEKDFVCHLHDESMLSVTQAQDSGTAIVIPKNILRKEYGINHHHRQPPSEFSSPLFLIKGVPMWLNSLLFNNPIVKFLRQYT